ncbi:guanine deaminase [Shewanella mangrovi]|uniref:Guanine deaminase n=1 Tax=Shewanella mangrovi TaxID=1515746 RepID=A0A094JCW0_9GAMM|nr:guanine deaminase [Shewanella mangrovi]KFZ37760.1 guanine deaminase [Shewanella mangrovi]
MSIPSIEPAVASAHPFAKNHAIRGSFLHFIANPAAVETPAQSYQYFADGLLVIEHGLIVELRDYHADDASKYPHLEDRSGQLIMPGFVDTHIHYAQTEMIAAYGEQLLEWLDTYTFPTEQQFADKTYASKIAKFVINELLKNGTTSALVFGTVHSQSVDAIFEQAEERHMRLIAGKVMMDRNAPDYLLDTPQSGYAESKALIEKWHNRGRLQYAITPRFAPTSTAEQLTLAGQLHAEYPDTYVQTHVSENKNEIEWAKSLFPECDGYFDIYQRFGLSGPKSIFSHAIHLTDEEWQAFSDTDSVIAFCPSSNMFLGSGLFPLARAHCDKVRVGLGTDVGAGTSFSPLQTLCDAYKVMQLQGQKLSALDGFYLVTLGGAIALSLDDKIGSLAIGSEADLVVLDWAATDVQRLRMQNAKGLEDSLFALMMLGDERNVAATYVAGRCVYRAD